MASPDTFDPAQEEDDLEHDLVVILRRAVALGRKLGRQELTAEIARIMSGNHSGADKAPGQADTPLPLRAAASAAKKSPKRKHPYGHVKETVAAAIALNADGITREQIVEFSGQKLKTNLSSGAVLTALKTLSTKEKKVYFRDKKWFPGKELIEQYTGQGAPLLRGAMP